MPQAEEKSLERINVNYPVALLKRIDTFWHKYQFKNRSSTILWLLEAALDAKLAPKKEQP